ncbi:MAG: DUF502 domain-containing protein [Chlamydiae bacterium]|jgi:uncharacterized membrane protein|nr:DUF502 domain-containing protein [Chlamydiota bacterium]
MRKNLLSGLIILLPITITLWLIRFFIDVLTNPFLGYVQNFVLFASDLRLNLSNHQTLLIFISRTLILILLFSFVFLLGYLGKKIFFHWFVKKIHLLILRIPLINSIYKACKDIISAVFSDDEKMFSRVVAVPFPFKDSRTLGLVAGVAPIEIRNKLPPSKTNAPMKVIFIATSPHPTSGFLLLTHEDQLINLDISLEDAFKFLISCGIYLPESQK